MTRTAAIHEAGHAVIARMLDVPVFEARLYKRPRRIQNPRPGFLLGQVVTFTTVDDDELGDAIAAEDNWKAHGRQRGFYAGFHALALVGLAGGIAERELCGHESEGTYFDEIKLAPYWPWIHHPRERLERMAAKLVLRHADKIEHVAARLLEVRRLGADELESLIAPSGFPATACDPQPG